MVCDTGTEAYGAVLDGVMTTMWTAGPYKAATPSHVPLPLLDVSDVTFWGLVTPSCARKTHYRAAGNGCRPLLCHIVSVTLYHIDLHYRLCFHCGLARAQDPKKKTRHHCGANHDRASCFHSTLLLMNLMGLYSLHSLPVSSAECVVHLLQSGLRRLMRGWTACKSSVFKFT